MEISIHLLSFSTQSYIYYATSCIANIAHFVNYRVLFANENTA